MRKRSLGSGLLLFCICVWARWVGAQTPVPLIYQPLVPSAIAPGGAAFTLTVRGTGFLAGAVVDWNGQPLATSFVSQGELTAQVPAGHVASAQTATITAHNPGVAPASNFLYFQVANPISRIEYTNAPGSPAWLGAVSGSLTFPYSIGAGGFLASGGTQLVMPVAAGPPSATAGALDFLTWSAGAFSQSPPSAGVGLSAGTLAFGDFKGDGRLDVATANFHDGTVSVLLNNGDGTFSPAPGSPYSVAANLSDIAVGDFNRDGKLDLAVSAGNGIYILLGNGDGSFTPAPGGPNPVPGPGAYGITVADLNGDGILDIATTDFGAGINILLGRGDGTFAPAPNSPFGLPNFRGRTTVLRAADVNGDGKLDLVVANGAVKMLTVLLGDGQGNFAQVATPVAGCCSDAAYASVDGWALQMGDFLANGRLDFAVEEQNVNSGVSECYLDIYLGNGDGTFTPSDYSQMLPDCPTGDFAVGDFNNDGLLDFATAANPQNYYNVLLEQQPTGPAPDFGITISDLSSASQTVQAGAQANYQLAISSFNGFTGPVAVACGPLPPDVTCSWQLAEGVIVPAPPNEPEAFYPSLTLTTTGPTSSDLAARPKEGLWLWFDARGPGASGTAPLALLALIGFLTALRITRSRLRPTWVAFALAVLVLGTGSCGGGASAPIMPPPPTVTPGTPPGSYSVAITATAFPNSPQAFSHTYSVTLVVRASSPTAARKPTQKP